jgi:hypothetical protein
VGPRAGMDAVVKRKIPSPCWTRTPVEVLWTENSVKYPNLILKSIDLEVQLELRTVDMDSETKHNIT